MTAEETERQDRIKRLREVQGMLRSALHLVGTERSGEPEVVRVIEQIRALKEKVDRALTTPEAGKSNMATMPNSRRTSLLASLISVFKAVPEDQLEDLRDALNSDSAPGADVFNSRLRHDNPDERQNPTGSQQAASGGGAVRMVGEYADTTGQSALVEQYAEMARELEAMRTRVAEVEKAQLATANAFAAMLGMSKNARVGKADDDRAEGPVERTGNEREDAEDVEKGIRTISVADMMSEIAGKARQTTVSPPNFAMVKSKVQDIDSLLESGTLTADQAIDAMALKNRLAAYHAGQINEKQLYQGLNDLPYELRPARKVQ